MRINGFRCDACWKEHLLDPTLLLQSYREALPTEWFLVSQGPYKKDSPWDQQEPWMFCSTTCLMHWTGKQVIAASEVAQDPNSIRRVEEATTQALKENERWENW